MSAALAARDLGLTYAGGVEALRDIRLDLAHGEFVSLVGPSGCGKSTLLRLAAGLVAPTSGVIRHGGARVGFVFQFPTLLPWRTVEENVALPAELHDEPMDQVAPTLAGVGLQRFAKSYPHELSGGMQMRAAFARALVTRPELLLLDEPFGALDEITRQRMNEELIKWWERDRWTALFVTHHVVEAAFLGSRVLVMSSRPGRIVAEFDSPFPHPRHPELRSHPEFASLCGRISAALREYAE